MTKNNDTFDKGWSRKTVTKQPWEIIFRFIVYLLVIQTITEMDPITVIGETISIIVIVHRNSPYRTGSLSQVNKTG